MNPLEFTAIPWGSKKYEQAIQLRNRELRIPLGLELSALDQDNERDQLHFGAFQDDTLVGCVSVVEFDSTTAKIRQMVVDSDHQKMGIGKLLMNRVEEELAELGKQTVLLHARTFAAGFYERLGYMVEGDEFIEVTIPHVRMRKRID